MYTKEVIILATCLIGFRISTGQRPSDCPAEFEYIEEINVCLKPILEFMPWEDSLVKCRDMTRGSHLAVILSEKGQAAVTSFLKKTLKNKKNKVNCKHEGTDGVYFWLGGKQLNPFDCIGSPYAWVTPLSTTMIFNAWDSTATNCSGACIAISSHLNFRWKNIECDYGQCALCEV